MNYSRKDLEDLYSGVAGKPVAQRKHLDILGEEYDVRFKKDTDTEYTEIKVGDEQFAKAFRYLKSDSSTIQTASDTLKSTGMNNQQIKELLNVVYDFDDPDKFFVALGNRMEVEEFLAATDVIDLVTDKYDLERELVESILRFEPATKPSTGKGEVFMMVFIDGAKKGSVGDVEINGVEYEVKGTNARIKGQRGFGAQTAGARSFTRDIQELAARAGVQVDTNKLNYNIQVKYSGGINDIASELTSTGKVTKDDIARIYANGLKEVYENADIEQDLMSWIKKNLDDSGTIINDAQFKKDYFTFAIQYYAKQESFDYLVAIGTAPSPKIRFGKMRYISREDIMSGNIVGSVLPDTYPSFLPGAGAQGGQFSIKPNI